MTTSPDPRPVLVPGGAPTRVASRKAEPPFPWTDPRTWPAVLAGVALRGEQAAREAGADWTVLRASFVSRVLDGRSECLADGVRQGPGRAPRDFAGDVRPSAATGVRA